MSSEGKSVEERLGVLEVKVKSQNENHKGLDKRVENVENDNKSLNRLTALLEKQMEMSEEKDKEHQEQITKQNEVLSDIRYSLTSINTSQKQLHKDFVDVKDRVGKLEENGKIDMNKLMKRIIWVVVPSLILTGILLAIGWK